MSALVFPMGASPCSKLTHTDLKPENVLFDFLKSNGYVPYPPAQVAHISMQLCRAVAFMHDR